MQVVRPDAIQRGDPAAEHMVAPAVPTGALDRGDVTRLLDHAQQARIASGIMTDGARVLVGQIAAGATRHHLAPDAPDRLRQPLCGLRRLLEEMEREPLGGLTADAGEL